jgi:hypothetical protein
MSLPREPTRLFLYISDAEAYIKGGRDYCFSLVSDKEYTDSVFDEWIYVCHIDIDFPLHVSETDIRQVAITKLEDRIAETRANAQRDVERLDRRRQELLALTYQGENNA